MTRPDYFPLPVSVDEITPGWFTAALRQRAPGVTVNGCEIVDFIHGTSTKIRFRLELDEQGDRAGIPGSVILKGGFEPHSRSLHYMHEREVTGYRDVLTALHLPGPDCYFADYDPERRQGIVIMEDLLASGVEFCHAARPQRFEQVARRLSVLARFHGSTWGSPELAAGGRWAALPDFLAAVDDFFALKTEPATWQRFVDSPRGAASSKRFHDRQWMLDAWQRLKHCSDQATHCVLHGDIHLGNLYIAPDGTPGFFDPLASRGPGLLEVAYHIPAAVDTADRPRWEGALVQHYLDELAQCGIEPPSFDDAMRLYGIAQVYGHFIWMTTESEYQAESVNTANAARVSAAMLDHDTAGLLETIATA